jgi:hypothetical protein
LTNAKNVPLRKKFQRNNLFHPLKPHRNIRKVVFDRNYENVQYCQVFHPPFCSEIKLKSYEDGKGYFLNYKIWFKLKKYSPKAKSSKSVNISLINMV